MTQHFLQELNRKAKTDPGGFIASCEQHYRDQVANVADIIADRQPQSPVVLLCGASSAGKTTTMDRISRALKTRHGIKAETISMDDYFRTVDEYEIPFDEENGVEDLESPLCMNLELLSDHLTRLVHGEEIRVPVFDFEQRRSISDARRIRLEPGEIVIIEGIHALSSIVTDTLGKCATGVFLSFESELVTQEGTVVVPEQLRFMRRAVRDNHFRGASVEKTLMQWKSVRRGEGLYIMPNRVHAELSIDTYLPYESFIISRMLQNLLEGLEKPLQENGFSNLRCLGDAFEPLEYLPYFPEDSLLHEFIG